MPRLLIGTTRGEPLMPLKHVLFDGQPNVICHVCPRHKAIADKLPCDDPKGTDGECAHVQYASCDCSDWVACDVCHDQVVARWRKTVGVPS